MERTRAGTLFKGRAGTRRCLPPTAGVTLVELMVTIVILSVAGLGLVGSFTYISRANQVHRTTTLGSNLSQEQMEVLKNKNYFEVIPTSAPSYNNTFNPPIPYDSGLYPPTQVNIGNMTFQRLTYVERVMASGANLVQVPPDSLDTGLKRITITTIWQIGSNWYRKPLTNLLASSQYSNASGFSGTVTDANTTLPIQGADVYAKGDSLFHDFTDANGNYVMSATPGSFSVEAQAPGYFAKTLGPFAITNGHITPVNFTGANALTPMTSGSVSGSVYVNRNLLISEVVTATNTVVTGGSTQLVEYLELFNPTTYQINITPASPSNTYTNESIKINSTLGGTLYNDLMSQGPGGVYVSTYVPSGGYYLFANYPAFFAGGAWITADAYFQSASPPPHYLSRNSYGGIQITDSSGNMIDQVCWQGSGGSPGLYCNGTPVPTDSTCGMNTGEPSGSCSGSPYEGNQLVRLSSIATLGRGTYGSAYNSMNNAVDFVYPIAAQPSTLGLNYKPFVSTSPVLPVVSGTPAYGAIVTSNDGLSASTAAWTVEISSGFNYLAISSVSVLTPSLSTTIPNAVTLPAWPAVGLTNALLTGTTTNGIISGQITDPNGVPLSGIQVSVHAASPSLTTAAGFYNISAPPNTYSVVANQNSVNPWYTSQQVDGIVVAAGQINNGNNFTLSGAGRVNGYVCNSALANVYPGVTIEAMDGNGNSVAQVVSAATGKFTINNLSTGTYTFAPVLDPDLTNAATALGTCSGAGGSISCSVTAGSNISIGTFTVAGAYGTISGNATCCGASGTPITTGVLILATTGTVAGALPPNISTAVLLTAPFYMASALSDGTFNLSVRASTASDHFNLYGWYTTYNGNTPVITKKSTNINVTGGQTSSTTLQW